MTVNSDTASQERDPPQVRWARSCEWLTFLPLAPMGPIGRAESKGPSRPQVDPRFPIDAPLSGYSSSPCRWRLSPVQQHLCHGHPRCWTTTTSNQGKIPLSALQENREAVDNCEMKVRVLALVATVTVLLGGPLAAPAHAATSQGCTGSITSTGSQNPSVDKVTFPGPGGTNAHPFRLYWADPVTWTGQTSAPMTDGTWRLTVNNASWLFGLGELVTGHLHGLIGTFNSGQGATSFANSFTPSSIEPVTLPGRYEVGFTVTGDGAVICTGTISVRVMDPPGHNPFWWLALILIIAGLVMLLVFGISKWTRPVSVRTNDQRERMRHTRARHVVANTLGGLLLGIGASLMTTLYGVVAWSTAMPDLIIVLGVILGLGLGLLPVRTVAGLTETKASRTTPRFHTPKTFV